MSEEEEALADLLADEEANAEWLKDHSEPDVDDMPCWNDGEPWF